MLARPRPRGRCSPCGLEPRRPAGESRLAARHAIGLRRKDVLVHRLGRRHRRPLGLLAHRAHLRAELHVESRRARSRVADSPRDERLAGIAESGRPAARPVAARRDRRRRPRRRNAAPSAPSCTRRTSGRRPRARARRPRRPHHGPRARRCRPRSRPASRSRGHGRRCPASPGSSRSAPRSRSPLFSQMKTSGTFQSMAMFIASKNSPSHEAPSPKKQSTTCPVFRNWHDRAAPPAIGMWPGDDRVRRDEADRRLGEVHRAALALADTRRAPHQLGHHRHGIDALDQRLAVAAVGREDEVVRAEGARALRP